MPSQKLSSATKPASKSPKTSSQFRIGRVQGYLRGSVWYLYYHEQGQRRRPRVGPDLEVARQMAAQINSQLETGAPAALSFESISIVDLQNRWLGHHEHVLRSSIASIKRYRAATEHLIRYVQNVKPVKLASHFHTSHAEDFVGHLRTIRVSPNGHPKSVKRPLLDKGIQYILETCRTLFAYAMKRRHLSPYAENPFSALELGRLPIEHVKPIILLTEDQQVAFLKACDSWQFPVYLTLMLTGLRPGELVHLLLPEDLDFEQRLLFVRNRINLGWQVKTRNERMIPMLPCLANVLKNLIGERHRGPVFVRRLFQLEELPSWASNGLAESELSRRILKIESESGDHVTRTKRAQLSRGLWNEMGIVETDRIRTEYMRLTKVIGQPELTAPKTLRHLFATALQDANVDPLIRNELMGHAAASAIGGNSLGMTANYTHTRIETKRRQLEETFQDSTVLRYLESLG
jgi:integrase